MSDISPVFHKKKQQIKPNLIIYTFQALYLRPV